MERREGKGRKKKERENRGRIVENVRKEKRQEGKKQKEITRMK